MVPLVAHLELCGRVGASLLFVGATPVASSALT
jgi:hypothetical protein